MALMPELALCLKDRIAMPRPSESQGRADRNPQTLEGHTTGSGKELAKFSMFDHHSTKSAASALERTRVTEVDGQRDGRTGGALSARQRRVSACVSLQLSEYSSLPVREI